jgi:type II secretory pathway component PulJ
MRKGTAYALIAGAALFFTLSPKSWAMLVPAQEKSATAERKYDRNADMKTVQAALESKIVRGRLKALGLDDREIQSRLSRLDDKQIHQLAKDIHTLSPGGDLGGLLVLVVLVLLIVYLVRRI